MKLFHVIHAIVTLSLLVAGLVILALTLTGVMEVRFAGKPQAHRPLTDPPDARPASDVGRVKARLLVLRGAKSNTEYPIYEGKNVIGRADQKPVDIDLEIQESQERIWSSRQHAVIACEDGSLVIEDLNSSNGTFVNGNRVLPGKKQPLRTGDVIQIGEVHLKVLL